MVTSTCIATEKSCCWATNGWYNGINHTFIHELYLGKVVERAVTVEGRKFSLLKIRQQMLEDQKTYMRLTTDNGINALTEAEIKERLQNNVQISSYHLWIYRSK